MVIHGESNIGKTLIVAKFQREHPTWFDSDKGVERREIVAMQMPATPDQRPRIRKKNSRPRTGPPSCHSIGAVTVAIDDCEDSVPATLFAKPARSSAGDIV